MSNCVLHHQNRNLPCVFEYAFRVLQCLCPSARIVIPAILCVTTLVNATEERPQRATSAESIIDNKDPFKVEGATPRIAFVFFAQTHVLPPESEYFKLVSDREALIEVQAYSKSGAAAPKVFATLALNGKKLELPLKGPSVLPPPPKVDPHVVSHSFKDSFTALIPKEWIQPGLAVSVEMRDHSPSAGQKVLDRKEFPSLKIGAPTKFVMCMFDVHFFGEGKGDYPTGWLEEMQSKLPVAEMELHRVHNIMFNKLVMVPRAGKPATLCSSRKEYEEKTGITFDGEQATATQWNAAIKTAAYKLANRFGVKESYYINIYGVPCGGVGGGFSGVGNGRDLGILWHELGHSWGLPHWSAMNYPYFGEMYGIPGDGDKTPHAGPTWAFDLSKLYFIPSTVQENRAFRGTPGNYKRDPMLGGGEGDQEKPYVMRHFSDYSMHRIQSCFEQMLVYDEQGKRLVKWNGEKAAYEPFKGKYSDWFPLERNVDIVTVLACASGVTPEANYIYTPIGPYKGDLVDLFEVPKDLSRASQRLYNESTCNLCLRVVQNGTARTYLANGIIHPTDNPTDSESLKNFAINVPAKNGKITQIDLLHTPDIFKTGNADGAKVLFSWKAKEHPEVELQTAEYFVNGKPVPEPPGSKPSAKTEKPVATLPVPPTTVASSAPSTSAPASRSTPAPAVSEKTVAPANPQLEQKAKVSEALKAEWFRKLVQKIQTAAASQKTLKGWVPVAGKAGTYPLLGADEKAIKVEFERNVMELRWSWLKPAEQIELVKSLVKEDDVESLLMLSAYLLADKQTGEGEDVLAKAALLDPDATAKFREQMK